MQCAEGSRADFRFVRAAFRNDKRSFLAVKLPLDRLRHRKLDIIEGLAGLLHDIVIDSEYFIRKRLSGWIEDGHELIADTVSDGHAEGIEIPCDIVDLVNPIRGAGYSAGDLNGPGLQPLLQYLYDILIIRFQIQRPCVDPLLLRDDLQLPEIASLLERSKYIVPKRRNEWRRRFVIQLLK